MAVSSEMGRDEEAILNDGETTSRTHGSLPESSSTDKLRKEVVCVTEQEVNRKQETGRVTLASIP